jgi:type VI secretion system protein ImpJ
LWHGERANSVEKGTSDAWQVKCLYQVKEVQSVDENTGENPRPVMVRKVNARLMLEGEDTADMEVLPLLRLARSGDAIGGRPEPDAAFIPPCYSLAGSPSLFDMAQDLASQVEANRRELVVQLTRGGFSIETIRGIQIEQMLRLKTLNRFSARLPALVRAPGVTPFEIYLEFGELLGELSALQPDRDPFAMPPYDHDKPGSVFPKLCDTIRSMLRGVTAASFLKEPFVYEPEDRAMYANLSEEDVSLANEFYLAIRTRDDPRAAAALVESADQFKVVPRSLIMKRVRGIRLEEERHPPLEFPAEAGLHYFRLMRDESPKIWEQIVREKTVGITWRGVENTDFSLTLCMTVPEVSQ